VWRGGREGGREGGFTCIALRGKGGEYEEGEEEGREGGVSRGEDDQSRGWKERKKYIQFIYSACFYFWVLFVLFDVIAFFFPLVGCCDFYYFGGAPAALVSSLAWPGLVGGGWCLLLSLLIVIVDVVVVGAFFA
jgi:hypothetical protein